MDLDPADYASGSLAGLELAGSNGGIWTVGKLVSHSQGSGSKFSFGYEVTDQNDRPGHLKAFDLSVLAARQEREPLEVFSEASGIFQNERDMLAYCRDARLSRVVAVYDWGTFQHLHKGARDWVFFNVCERAESDVRERAVLQDNEKLRWACEVFHNATLGVNQIHRHDASHNDIKPSNILYFALELQKIGDFGHSTRFGRKTPWDKDYFPGDQAYAPPEALYRDSNDESPITFGHRRATDLYMLGSIGYFLIMGIGVTSAILTRLPTGVVPLVGGPLADALPYWQQVHGQLMDELLLRLRDAYRGEEVAETYVRIVREMTSPDIARRGHPRDRASVGSNFGTQRFQSELQVLCKRMSVARPKNRVYA